MIGENAGDSIAGERIVCEARIVSKPVLIHRKTQGAEAKAHREACCMLDREANKRENLGEMLLTGWKLRFHKSDSGKK